MKVETYEIEDARSSEASAMAHDSEALELIEKLGLEGQKRSANSDTATRVPYRAMEEREAQVYRALCDRTSPIESYSADSIPLRVLQAAAFAKECSMFTRLEVWYPSEAKIDDPILVGVIKTLLYPDDERYRSLTRDTFYMIARWGKELLTFEQLEAIAMNMLRKKRVSDLKKALIEAQTALTIAQETEDIAELSKGVSFNA